MNINFFSVLLIFFCAVVFYSCDYKKGLLSTNKTELIETCKKAGDYRDTSAVKLLLRKSLDPRLSTDLRFKGFSVNYFRIQALEKISGLNLGRKIDQFGPDTAATMFYVDWAIKNGFVKDLQEADIYYY